MNKFLRGLIDAVIAIPLSSIAQAALKGLGGIWGWVGFIVGPIFRSIEAAFDRRLKQVEKDADHDEEAKNDATRVENAKTDEEIDDAARDSLRG